MLIVGVLVLIFCILGAQKTFALKRAIFPDGKLLQPIPSTTIHPNISGNVNSTVGVSQTTQASPKIKEENNIPNPSSQNNKVNKEGFGFYLTWFSIILLIIFLVIFGYKKIKQK